VAEGSLVTCLHETSERRRGGTIAAAGVFRDPARSCRRHFVEVRGLRWICTRLLMPTLWHPVGGAPTTTATRDGSVMRM